MATNAAHDQSTRHRRASTRRGILRLLVGAGVGTAIHVLPVLAGPGSSPPGAGATTVAAGSVPVDESVPIHGSADLVRLHIRTAHPVPTTASLIVTWQCAGHLPMEQHVTRTVGANPVTVLVAVPPRAAGDACGVLVTGASGTAVLEVRS